MIIIHVVYGTFTMLNFLVYGYCLESYKMHALCGSTLDVTSGQLEFDTTKLSSEVLACQVTMTTKSCNNCSHTIKHSIMFYISSYSLPDECRYINISLFDGYANSSMTISGVRELLCGRSPGLTNQDDCLFTTSNSVMTVSFTRTKKNKHLSANFTIIYSSFHNGTCDVEEDNKCSVRNSGSFQDTCFDNKDMCKRFNNAVCYVKPDSENSKIVQYILCGLLGIVGLFGLKFLYHQYKLGEEDNRMNDSNGHFLQNLKIRITRMLNNVQSFMRTDSTDLESSSSSSYSNTDTNRQENGIHRSHFTNISSLESQTVQQIQPSAPQLELTHFDLPAPPYEESPVPSYTEVMTHKDKYVVH